MKHKYVKTYKMKRMKRRDVDNLREAIRALGFSTKDYKIVYYGSHNAELKVVSRDLHWILKSLSKLERAGKKRG